MRRRRIVVAAVLAAQRRDQAVGAGRDQGAPLARHRHDVADARGELGIDLAEPPRRLGLVAAPLVFDGYWELQIGVLMEEMAKRRLRVNVIGEPERVAACFVHGYKQMPVELSRY